ncbi:MAG TPA: sugar phosphate isomerase/epimerase [Victivallales bacterium]|nr:sugar phosphate isomerase/epimerase [Victivallales bacterium]HPO90686.1 sugar phosphate isomerase/epimerase [Victivallales bacterium]HRR07013.1 sugar phosphate isomerase/epimerase [Victivallales bacterium]HRR28910.1 sugar phosphate isomerase/epimerase [Victivallales bacterium]HRU01399.1 sugar phosphate isomerase/epimerase [Victivallales bacterium]
MNLKVNEKEKIKIGTLVSANQKDPAEYIRQIMIHGFESFSITFWQKIGDKNLKKLADEIKKVLDGTGIVISSIGIFGNPLETSEIDKQTAKDWAKIIDNAHLFGTDIVAGFTGRVRGKSIPDSIPRFKKIFEPLAKRAKDKGVRIAFENCDMGGSWQSGDWNIAHTPPAWEMIFDAIPFDNIGLEWEPCHQMVKLIDPMPQLRKYAKKIFHIHGKDATIYWDVVKEYGILGPKPFAFHRTPGFGDSNWTNIISELRAANYSGSIDIEGWHDPVYRGELEMTGQVHALNYLKKCRATFVDNPNVP